MCDGQVNKIPIQEWPWWYSPYRPFDKDCAFRTRQPTQLYAVMISPFSRYRKN